VLGLCPYVLDLLAYANCGPLNLLASFSEKVAKALAKVV
jgi:hypothetical protein